MSIEGLKEKADEIELRIVFRAAAQGDRALFLRSQQRVARAFGGHHGAGGHGDLLHNLHLARHALGEVVELLKGLVE